MTKSRTDQKSRCSCTRNRATRRNRNHQKKKRRRTPTRQMTSKMKRLLSEGDKDGRRQSKRRKKRLKLKWQKTRKKTSPQAGFKSTKLSPSPFNPLENITTLYLQPGDTISSLRVATKRSKTSHLTSQLTTWKTTSEVRKKSGKDNLRRSQLPHQGRTQWTVCLHFPPQRHSPGRDKSSAERISVR